MTINPTLNPTVRRVTDRIIRRSQDTRQAYLDFIAGQAAAGPDRTRLGCGNLAHAFAASGPDKGVIRKGAAPNIAIVTAFNDMLSAHQPYGRYPDQIKLYAREVGATAQVAGGVPAMCDGVTQGQRGMELSLWSRDTIAMATMVSLSHDMFDGVALLGICDKIVPGLLMGALRFGHLPAILVPSGPMPSGLPNKEKQRVRQLHAEGRIDRDALLDAEAASYHDAGTCTFYGTANSNQMMVDVMGLTVPGSVFVNPGTALRQALTRAAIQQLADVGRNGEAYRPLGRCVDEKAIVNAMVGLLATGGSTNHTIHLPAIARAAGILIDWDDFDELSRVTPMIAAIYPNGSADVNAFEAAGGMGFAIATLLDAGLLHGDILTVAGAGLADHGAVAALVDDRPVWRKSNGISADLSVLRPASDPFVANGGLRVVTGNLGRGIFKTSAVAPDRWTIDAPARVFADQDGVLGAFKAGELDRDVVVVVRFQGPRVSGMPELHRLMPALGVLQDRGYQVALVTDGRLSGASGKVPAAIHVYPEAGDGGPLARLQDGDRVRLCAGEGRLDVMVGPADWNSRDPAQAPSPQPGAGRELFALMRINAPGAEQGASPLLAAAGL
ncbi:MAG: phosphogluconate dehydratase [Sphingomonadales bacterium]